MRPSPVALACLLLAGCASTPAPQDPSLEGQVGYRAVEPEGAERLQLAEGSVFQLGRAIADERVLPTYPAEWIGRAPERLAVCVELHVGDEGAVRYAAALVQGSECPPLDPALAEAFHAAAIAAARRWRFEPSYVCQREEGMLYDDCEEPGKPREAVALLRAYRFEFVQVEGRASVVVGEQR